MYGWKALLIVRGGMNGSGGDGSDEVVVEESARGRVVCGVLKVVRLDLMTGLEGCRRTREIGGGVASSMEEPGLGGCSG